MGIPLFSALGQLGAQWGQAKEETAQDALRTQQIAAQLKRQDAMQQLAQQRAGYEQERVAIDRERLANTMAEQKQKAEEYYQAGWDPKNAMVMKDPDNPSKYLVKNLRAQPGQEFTRRVDKGQGYMTFEEEQQIKKPEKESAAEGNFDINDRIVRGMGYKPGTKQYWDKMAELTRPAGAKLALGLGGGGGTDPALLQAYVSMLQQGNPITAVPMKDRAKAWKALKDSGQPLPFRLRPEAQQVIEQTVPIRNSVEQIMAVLEPLKNDNKPGKFLGERLKYMVGMASPDVQVIGDATKLVSATELTRLMAAARVMRASSRTLAVLNQALVHVPNMWRDSPMKQYGQWQVVLNSLDEVDRDAFRLGQMGGVYPGNIPGLGGPAGPSTGGPPPSAPGAGSDPLNMYGGGPPK